MNREQRRRAAKDEPQLREAFHLSEAEAAVLGRQPSGRGQLGLPRAVRELQERPRSVVDVPQKDWEGLHAPADDEQPSKAELEQLRASELPPGTNGIVIITEDDLDGIPSVWHGQFIIDSAIPGGLAFNWVDPRGCKWEGLASLQAGHQALLDFLAGDDPYLELASPIDGRPHFLMRAAAERVLIVAQARTKIRNPLPRASDPRTVLIPASPEILASLGR